MYQRFTPVLAAVLLLSSCDDQPTFCPKPPASACSTPATLVPPVCNVLNCSTHPVMLQLANGQILNPLGTTWQSFRADSSNWTTQNVRIDYQPEVTPHMFNWTYATITCISTVAP